MLRVSTEGGKLERPIHKPVQLPPVILLQTLLKPSMGKQGFMPPHICIAPLRLCRGLKTLQRLQGTFTSHSVILKTLWFFRVICPGVGLLGHMAVSAFHFLRTLHTVHSGCPIYAPATALTVFSRASPAFTVYRPFDDIISDVCEVIPHCSFERGGMVDGGRLKRSRYMDTYS